MHVNASKTMELKWVKRPKCPNSIDRVEMLSKTKSPPLLSQALLPIFISAKHSHVNPDELAQLFSSCNFSCHRFPKYVDSESHTPLVEDVDVRKLRVALSHSFVLVSVFCKPQDVLADSSSSTGLGGFFERLVTPASPNNGQLVGFGRAVSDQGLTASIYDVMVLDIICIKWCLYLAFSYIVKNRYCIRINASVSLTPRLFLHYGDWESAG